jgi:DNA-binding SARP family transcriptional activator
MGQNRSVTLLGGFSLTVDGDAVDLPTSSQRLVAALALDDRWSRTRLAHTLWPRTAEHRALARLRTGIWRLNQIADDLVRARGTTIELNPDIEVDVHRLLRAGRAVLRSDHGADDDIDMVLDGGELLPDWAEDWLLTDRERLRQLRLHVLDGLSRRLSQDGNYGLALEVAHTALRTDAARESAHRRIISIHVAEGNLREARRAYDACRLALRRDADAEPSSAVVDLLTLCPR